MVATVEQKTETRYQVLQNIDLVMLVKRGFISTKILGWKTIYEFYLKDVEKVNTLQAVTNTAEEYNICEKTVYNIINYMKG